MNSVIFDPLNICVNLFWVLTSCGSCVFLYDVNPVQKFSSLSHNLKNCKYMKNKGDNSKIGGLQSAS